VIVMNRGSRCGYYGLLPMKIGDVCDLKDHFVSLLLIGVQLDAVIVFLSNMDGEDCNM